MADKTHDPIKKLMEEVERDYVVSPNKVIPTCKRIIEESKKSNYDEGVAFGEYYITNAYFRINDSENFIEHAINGMTIHKNGFYSYEARTYNLLGNFFAIKWDMQMAILYYIKGLELAKSHKHYDVVQIIYNNIGELYMNLGDYKSALEYFSLSLSTMERTQNSTMKYAKLFHWLLYGNFVDVYLRMGRIDEAKQKLDHFHEIEKHEFYQLCKFFIDTLRARVLFSLGNNEEAIGYVKEVLNNLKNPMASHYSIRVYQSICKILIEKGYMDIAKKLIDYTVALSKELDNIHIRLSVYENVILYYQKENNNTELLKAYDVFYKLQMKKATADNNMRLQNISRQMNFEESLKIQKNILMKNERLKRLSEVDALTGLQNRYSINKYCNKMFKSACNLNVKFGLIIIDIDYFKQYNDTFGHVQGDKCIKEVAKAIRDASNNNLLAGRYGGDEFLILSFDHSDETLEDIAQQVSHKIRSKNISNPKAKEEPYITVTQGIVNAVPKKEQTVTDFIHMADIALYKAKANGKGTVGVYSKND